MIGTYRSAGGRFRFRVGLIFILALVAAIWPQNLQAIEDTIYFPETGMSVSFGFKRFFEERGGLEIFGYPITPEIQENGFTVQYFQRARYEYHPEHAGTRYEVQLGLLGDILTSGRDLSQSDSCRDDGQTSDTFLRQAMSSAAHSCASTTREGAWISSATPSRKSFKRTAEAYSTFSGHALSIILNCRRHIR